MKTFNNSKDATNWLSGVIDNTANNSVPIIAEQIYKDSKELTYYSDQNNTTHMYDTGEINSDFKNGIIIERTPYVRRRYYEGGVARGKHKQAQPHWFEKTVDKYGKDYNKIIANQGNKAKKA